MYPPFPQRAPMPDRERSRHRTAAFLLALAVHALVIMLLLRHEQIQPLKVDRQPTTFLLMPEPRSVAAGEKKAVTKTKPASAPSRQPPAKALPVTPPEPVSPFLALTKDQFAASDIANLPQNKSSQNAGGTGRDSGTVSGPGEGPGGAQLYDAEWYRHPTDAELAGYLPADAPRKGWGLVACKTVENYHVDNCQSLAESPPGSGLAKAVRQAAWQFLVLPPRIDGQPIIGAWVRIRIDYSEGVPS